MSASTDAQKQSEAQKQESERWWETYRSPAMAAGRQKRQRERLERLGVFDWPRDAKLLDLCCGPGEVLRQLHAEGFTNLHGSDVARDEALGREPWLELTTADCHALPYADNTFDAVICMHALHHMGGVGGIEQTLREAVRILKPGGRLALIDFWTSLHLRFTFWCFRQRWLPKPTAGIKHFSVLIEEEWPYLSRYVDEWPKTRAVIESLPCERERLSHELYYFHWVGKKRKL